MNSSASDVSAVILSIGEATTADAIRAVQAQTLPPCDIVVVENVSPFHRAFNQGAAQVRSRYFVQVDADMVLDPHCFETFRSVATPEAGIVSGFLRDPLLGRICCVKMFNTECAGVLPLRDVVSFETDFVERMLAGGWMILRGLSFIRADPAEWHSFGEHRREYTPHYTFAKFVIEGRKARLRRKLAPLRGRLATLHKRPDAIAAIAQIGMLYGIFCERERDLLVPFEVDADWHWLSTFLARDGAAQAAATPPSAAADPAAVFGDAYGLGVELRAGNGATFCAQLRALGAADSPLAWVAQAGLCAGLFAERFDLRDVSRRYSLLRELLE